jgi:hypothetical protein
MPGAESSTGRCDEGVVMYYVTVRGDQRFGKTDDWFQIEQVKVGWAVFEHSVVQLNPGSRVFGVYFGVKIFPKLSAVFFG